MFTTLSPMNASKRLQFWTYCMATCISDCFHIPFAGRFYKTLQSYAKDDWMDPRISQTSIPLPLRAAKQASSYKYNINVCRTFSMCVLRLKAPICVHNHDGIFPQCPNFALPAGAFQFWRFLITHNCHVPAAIKLLLIAPEALPTLATPKCERKLRSDMCESSNS